MSKSRIRIDGREHGADDSRNLLEIALELGYDLPYFCWHPALGSVGACRQCAVTQYQDDKDETGRVVMACMTPCSDGGRFSISAAAATEMRAAVIEFLMINHPHDCPVCEEGGNCHLQDMTVMTGHTQRRYRHSKRSHRNQDLGPCVSHEMNRCIACYRCVRYYRDYAGGADLNVFGAHDNVYFGRAQDGTLESEFSGNLVEVCPTGVFTDKPYGDTYTRKWDLQQAPGICGHCSIGCNVSPGERYGQIRRIENRYHGDINGYFLCDRGRYGYPYSNDPKRPRQARRGSETLSAAAAAQVLARLIRQGDVVGIGSPRASLEANFALRRLVGHKQFYRGESRSTAACADAGLGLLRDSPIKIATVRDCERADAALVLGEDVLNTGARIALALRQMIRQQGFAQASAAHVPVWQDHSVRLIAQQQRNPLFIASPCAGPLDDIASARYRATPVGIARLGHALARALDPSAPEPKRLPQHTQKLAERIASALTQAERPLLVTGTGCAEPRVLIAAQAVAHAYFAATGRKLQVAVVFTAVNSMGTALLGGKPLDGLTRRHQVRTAIVLENELEQRLSALELAELRTRIDNLVVITGQPGALAEQADLLLPAGSQFESAGTFINHEGRAQRNLPVFAPDGDIRPAWRWLQQAAHSAGLDKAPPLGQTLDDLTQACATAEPHLAGIVEAAPDADFRLAGNRIPRQSVRASGRTAMQAHLDLHEARPSRDRDSAMSFSMEGAQTRLHTPSALTPMFWAPRWNSIQAVNKFQQEIGGALRGGNPGRRLLGEDWIPRDDGYNYPPPPSAPNRLRAVPIQHLFGSEILSAAAAPLRERGVTTPYLALHPQTADKLGLAAADTARFRIGKAVLSLSVQLRQDLDRNAAGLPFGLSGIHPGLFGQQVRRLGDAEDD